jgi:hypothetical protein
MTALIACAVLTLALAVYVFFPEKQVAAQSEKSRLEYLGERKAVLYDNLRDLSFEHRAGKYRDDEYATERVTLEAETAAVVTEMDELERPVRAQAQR